MSSDPTTWGVQDNGFVVPTATEILERLEEQERAYIDPNIDVEPDSPLGQQNGIFAAQLATAWEGIGALEAARSRDGAEGALLDEQGKLTGSARNPARATVVPCTVALTAGTTLLREHLASVAGKPELTFYPLVDETTGFTATSTTTYTISFECSETGPITVLSGTLTVITTPVSGWTSITNPTSGTVGADVDTDAEYRLEQDNALAAAGSSTAAAIQAALAYDEAAGTGVEGVISCSVLENYTDTVDGNGVPPHSIEVVVYTDGTESANDIAAKIFTEKPAGCGTYGDLSGTYTDVNGTTHTVYYSEVTPVPIYLSYTLTTGTGYVGATAVKAYVVAQLTERSVAGTDVNYVFTRALPMALTGVADVPTFTLGTSPTPSGTSNIAINVRQIATFDVARVVVS